MRPFSSNFPYPKTDEQLPYGHMILSVLPNYTNPTPSGHRKPRETTQNPRNPKSSKFGCGAFLQLFLMPPVFQANSKQKGIPRWLSNCYFFVLLNEVRSLKGPIWLFKKPCSALKSHIGSFSFVALPESLNRPKLCSALSAMRAYGTPLRAGLMFLMSSPSSSSTSCYSP